MKRIWVAVLMSSGVVLAGCGLNDYNSRLEETMRVKKRAMELDQNLQKPAEGKFKEYNVYLRVPKPLNEAATEIPGAGTAFDHVATFEGSPPPPPAKEGEAAAPALPALKLHVLVRNKPKKVAAKKGEPAPAPDPAIANRGDFASDVRVALAKYGQEAAEKPFKAEKRGTTSYQSMVFKDPSTGNDIRVYLAGNKDSDSQVALVFDIPPKLLTLPIVTKGVDFAVESFASGAAARKLFTGGATPGKPATEGPGF